MVKIALTLLLCLPLTACYYMQAAKGQWEVIHKREPVDEVIADPDTPPELAARLGLLDEARDFSVAVLGLPDNNSYRGYSELQRDYVVWNVFAAPEFSLQPKQWCFPIAGCVSYRGYFSEAAAVRESAKLAADGYDVHVGGVAAYSTLGNFSDPILSTMLHWNDMDLIALLFHELAHQVVYVKGDSTFNESFATAVEEFGVEQWLEVHDEQEKMADYYAGRELQEEFVRLVVAARQDLEGVYGSEFDDERKRELKRERLDTLAHVVAAKLQSAGRDGSAWLDVELNNARLVSTALYHGYLPAFRIVYDLCSGEMLCFYESSRTLAKLSVAQREALLSTGDLLRIRQALNLH